MKNDELLTVSEVCRELHVSHRTFYNLLNKGGLSAKKLGRKTLIERSEIMRFRASLPDYTATAT